MNPFMNPSLFASLSYQKTKTFYNLFQAQAGKGIIPPEEAEETLIILPWALRKKGGKG
jgi:hypothetical protein